jgi:hypothetical protein
VFDLVNKYRTPVMWLCVVLMGGFGAFYLVADGLASGSSLPIEEIARFTLPGGKTVSITNEDLIETRAAAHNNGMLASRQGSSAIPLASTLGVQTDSVEEAVFAFIILRAAAKAAGFDTTDASIVAEINESMRRNVRPGDPTPEEYSLADYRKRPEGVRRFWRELSIATRYRRTLEPVEEPTYDRLFERFKTDYEKFRVEFALFDGATATEKFDPRASAEDRAALEKWFSEEAQQGVRTMKQIPEQGDFEVLYARFRDADADAVMATYAAVWAPKAAEAGVTVSDEEIRSRFDRHRDGYEAALDAAKKKAEAESRPAGDDFESVKELIRAELTALKLAAAAHAQLLRPELGLTFDQVKDAYGMRTAVLNKADTVEVVKQPDFGSAQAQSAIFEGFATGELKKGDILNFKGVDNGFLVNGPVDDPGRSVSIWRVLDRRDAREPVLDDPGILDYAIEKYLEKKRQDEAKRLADEFKKAVDDKVAELVKAREAELDAEMAKEVDEEIAKQGLSKDKVEDRPKIVQIENQRRVERNKKLDEAKAEHEARVFREVAAEKGVTVRDSGWLTRNVTSPAVFSADGAKLPLDEKAARFFRKPQRMAAISGMKVGRVGQTEAESAWAVAAVTLLAERKEPAPAEFWNLNEVQMARLRQSVQPAQPPVWNYEALKSPKWFGLDAPMIEEQRAQREASRATDEAMKRRIDERKRETLKRRAQDLVEAVRDRTSPIKSGENW